MLLLIAAMSAAQMLPPKPVKPWITGEDHVENFYGGVEGASLIRVTVTPDGRPDACTVEWSTGNDRMDRMACRLTMRRSEWNAARDDHGKATWGRFEEVVNFYTPTERESRFPMQKRPDLELMVKHLPEDANEATVRVAVAVDPEGELSACAGEPEAEEQLASIACRQLTASWQTAPAVNAAGSPIAYVVSRKVHFRTE